MTTASADAFLGNGWGFPPEFLEGGTTVRMVSGIDDIKESLHILLSTVPGERVMLPDYGCDIHRFVFQRLSAGLTEQIRDAVSTAIERWETRIELLACLVSVSPDEPGLILIEISYRVRRTNARGNYVYPFYIDNPAATDIA
jgi:Bacteriophage baseplate protein W